MFVPMNAAASPHYEWSYPFKRIFACWDILCILFMYPILVAHQQQTEKHIQNMILVEGGTFEMGSIKGYVMEQPIHTVTLPDFYIDKYEVTVAEYREFCKATKRKMPVKPPWGWSDNHPVTNISWNDAHEYASWLGKRLLTEAEWEYAARGGKFSEGYEYSGSDKIEEVGWFNQNSATKTHIVGQKKPNELGIYDMTGNAIEWCEDWYDDLFYHHSSKSNPLGPDKGTTRVIRGGSFSGDRDDCRVTKRSYYIPFRGQIRIGFRCAMSK